MNSEPQLCFPPFRLDLVNEQLWRGRQEIPLRQKTFAVLRYLVEHPDQLVTKEALLDAVWAGTAVSDVAPGVCVQELRHALGEDRQTPRFIVTVHRRGYRFIAPLTTAPPVSSSQFPVPSSLSAIRNSQSAINPVGREAELSQLHQVLGRALGGERQLVFVTGEAGIGKTTLVEAFLARITRGHEHEHEHEIWIGRGQCIEHYGAGEAYMPVLEALGRLCRAPGGERLIALLAQQAPTWLMQMPALLSAAELETLQRKVLGATQGRMLREMAEAVEVLTAETPLILVLEDLQWSDASTLEWLSALARRQERARLLVIGTYRAVDVIVREHPLKAVKQELQLHGYCDELPLGCLSEAAVAEYLAVRFVSPSPSQGEGRGEGSSRASLQRLARVIYQRTDGNPLFLVTVADYLVTQGVIVQGEGSWELKGELEEVEGGMPESLRQMIAKQIERLSPEDQRVLEVGSVAGVEFSAAAVAAGIEAEVVQVEERCEGLVRREQLLRAKGPEEWPDETVAARYGFLHALYQEVLYEGVTAGRRSRVHRRIGERKETAYGKRAGEIAAELALHFEQGRDYRKAIQYLQQAGENASRRSAYQETLSLLTKGLELLKTLPDIPERAQQETTLQLALSVSLATTKGFAAPAVEQACTRALELCRQLGETTQLLPVLLMLSALYLGQGKLQMARELAEQSLTLAQRAQGRAFLLEAHNALGNVLFFIGEFALAREHVEQGSALYDPQQHHSMAFLHGLDPGVTCLSRAAIGLGLLGYPDQALQRIHAALSLAQELSHPSSLAYALDLAAAVHLLRREAQAAQEHAEALIALSREHGFSFRLAQGTILRGGALAAQGRAEEGIAQMRQGLAAVLATGVEVTRPYYLALLAEAYGRVGQIEEGLAVLAEALAVVHKIGQHGTEGLLYLLKGELTLQKFQVSGSKFQVSSTKTRNQKRETRNHPPIPNPQTEAEACFHKAIEIARKQQAKSLELRAVMSLSRLCQQQGKRAEARRMLAEIYGWFTEGFDTKDLQEAKALLEELA